MTFRLDPNIVFRIMIVDADTIGVSYLVKALSCSQIRLNNPLKKIVAPTIQEAYSRLESDQPNVIFIDIFSTGLRDSITFIQHVRIRNPTVVFVLYCDVNQLNTHKSEIYSGWGQRLKHYFLLPKQNLDKNFENEVFFNLVRVQFDLYAYGAHDSLERASFEKDAISLTDVQFSKLESQYQQLILQMKSIQDKMKVRSLSKNHQHENHAFIVIAFNNDLQDVYEIGIREFLKNECGLTAQRIDEKYPHGLIIEHIYEEIHNSTVVIAELTYPRPNCYYELGFADAIGKPVVRLARRGTKLPFDVNQHPFIFYNNVADLRPKLKKALIDLGVVKKGNEGLY